ncbi:hypothetical protein GCM10023321_30310 [Pseudonocardia eucalypti]|uniref:Uncharacterized protein n=1 Tax=Pseudonocardia eucalypti TaxID=648755 RepID=A0ABP9Q2W5_9PSEU
MNKRRPRRRVVEYSGQIQRVGGSEGRRLQAELAAVVRELLVWAAEDREDRLADGRGEAQRDRVVDPRGTGGDERAAA